MHNIHQVRLMSADEAFIMQRQDGEVMLSFFKALVSDPPPAEPQESSLDDAAGIADRFQIQSDSAASGKCAGLCCRL